MKKAFLVAGLAVAISISAAAQTKKKVPPPPPKPPKPPVEVTDRIPPPPPPPPPAPPAPPLDDVENLPDDFRDFLSRNPSIESLHWTDDAIVIVPKNGKKERYLLNEKSIREAEAKYGKLPTAPPPPPAPPAAPKAPRPPKPEQDLVTISRVILSDNHVAIR